MYVVSFVRSHTPSSFRRSCDIGDVYGALDMGGGGEVRLDGRGIDSGGDHEFLCVDKGLVETAQRRYW